MKDLKWTVETAERRLRRRMTDLERDAFAAGEFPRDWPGDEEKAVELPSPLAPAIAPVPQRTTSRGDIERRPPQREVERLLDARTGVAKLDCGHRTKAKKYVRDGALPEGLWLPCSECPPEVVRS